MPYRHREGLINKILDDDKLLMTLHSCYYAVGNSVRIPNIS